MSGVRPRATARRWGALTLITGVALGLSAWTRGAEWAQAPAEPRGRATQRAGADDPRSLIERGRGRYVLERPLEVVGRLAQCWGGLPERELGIAREVLERDTHEGSKPDTFFVQAIRTIYDGTGRVRREVRGLSLGGPESRATTVRILDGTRTVEAAEIGAEMAMRADRMVPGAPPGSEAAGSPWHDEIVQSAFDSFPHRCRWALGRLADAPEPIETRRVDDRRVRLYSAAVGVRVTMDTDTGEVECVERTGPRGGVEAVWVTAWHPEPVLPARYPRAIHGRPADPERDEPLSAGSPGPPMTGGGQRTVIDSVRVPAAIDPSLFRWQSVARWLHDYNADAVLDGEERLDEARTASLRQGPGSRRELAEREPVAGVATPARRPGASGERWLWYGGLAVLASGALAWRWRRRSGV